MVRFVQAALIVAGVAVLGGCSSNTSELEELRAGRGTAAQPAPTSGAPNMLPGTQGLPTTPNAGTGLPGTAAPPGATPPPPPGPTGCQPNAPAGPVPVWKPPSQPRAACTQQEGAFIVNCAFGNKDCGRASQLCSSCAVSPKGTSQFYGPIIVDETTGALEINVEGCAAIMANDITATGCGPKLQARYACEEQACMHCASPQEMQACMQQADTTVCATQVANANACLQYANQCLAGGTEADVAFQLIGLFCGG